MSRSRDVFSPCRFTNLKPAYHQMHVRNSASSQTIRFAMHGERPKYPARDNLRDGCAFIQQEQSLIGGVTRRLSQCAVPLARNAWKAVQSRTHDSWHALCKALVQLPENRVSKPDEAR